MEYQPHPGTTTPEWWRKVQAREQTQTEAYLNSEIGNAHREALNLDRLYRYARESRN